MTWQPPENPEPGAIHVSVRNDLYDGLHAQAFEKILWLHHNALRYDPTYDCVRLSFALGDWVELADIYPPAQAALIRTRDQTEAAFRNEPFRFELFDELAALNGFCLGEGARTAALFVEVAAYDHELAQELYRAAEPYLIAAGRFKACGPFLDPHARMKLAADQFNDEVMRAYDDELSRLEEEMDREMCGTTPKVELQIPKTAHKRYVDDIATLIGLLVQNQRVVEANRVHAEALALIGESVFRWDLDAALRDRVPTPQHQQLEVLQRRRRELREMSLRYLNGSGNAASS
jgi:hypothetical protein